MSLDFDERDRRSVIGDLRSEDPEVRRLAVERLSVLPREEAVERLLDRLGDPDWRVRRAAVERLIDGADVCSTAEGLIAALGDPANPGRRGGAVEALIRCGPGAVPKLVEASAAADPEVRKFAVDALAGIGDARAASAVLARLVDPEPEVRSAAADALGALGGEQAERALCELAVLEGEDRLVRLAALRALDALEVGLPRWELLPMLDDPVLRPVALPVLAFDGHEESLEILLKSLVTGSRAARESTMRSILRFLSRVDSPSLERAIERVRESVSAAPGLFEDAFLRLEEADLATRLVLVQFLGLLESDESVIPILRAARHDPLRDLALGTLAAMGERAERAVDAEWGRLEPDLRRLGCILFGRLRGRRGAVRLIGCLEDAASATRAAAARAAASCGLEEAVPLLVRGLERAAREGVVASADELEAFTEALASVAGEEADPRVRRRAADLVAARLEAAEELRGEVRQGLAAALARIARRDDLARMARLLEDPLPRVRRAAVDALARIQPPTVPGALRIALGDESPLVRIGAAAALEAIESDGVQDDLEVLAGDPDGGVRGAALRALGRRFARHEDGDRRERVLGRLRTGLSDEAPVAVVALEILRDIGAARGAWVLPVLERPETEVLREAVRCLCAIGDGPQVDALLPLVSHPVWSVRADVIQGLAQRRRIGAAPAILGRLETEQHSFVREVMLAAMRRLEG